jgi:hypothetical protein
VDIIVIPARRYLTASSGLWNWALAGKAQNRAAMTEVVAIRDFIRGISVAGIRSEVGDRLGVSAAGV